MFIEYFHTLWAVENGNVWDESRNSKTYSKKIQFTALLMLFSFFIFFSKFLTIFFFSFQLTCWPERGVPARATNLLEYMRRVKSVTKESHPTVVHCTTGAGRTGCFIALDMALDMAREEGLIDIKGLVEGLRSRRPHMVESLQQYEWLHDAALEAVLCGDTCVYGMDLTSHYDHLITLDPVCGQAPIVEEFETLVIMTPKLQIAQHCTTALLQKNKQKNRYADVLPADAHLPSLTLDNRWFTTSQNETYINATLCDSYSRPGELIISQTPQPHTVVDFWRLIWDYGVYSVVMTDDLGEHDESCQIYWPRGSVSANSTQDRNNAGNGKNNGNSDHNLLNNSLNDSSASSRSDRSDTPCSSNTNAGEVCVRYGPFEIELLTKDDEIDLAVRTLKITKKLAPINGNHSQNGHNSMNSSGFNPNNNPQFNQFQSSRDNSINSRHLRNSETRIIKHFQLLAWPPKNAVPTSRNSTLRIISLLQKWRKEVAHSTGQTLSPIDGPEAPAPRTLVHCIAGAGRSGTFSCCYNVVEQIMAEKSADIFSQALKLRSHRPQMIEGLDQYRFVYEVAGTFVDDTFENGDKTL